MKTGYLRPGLFSFDHAELAPGRVAPVAIYAFDGVTASDAEFDLTDVSLAVQNSEFTRCWFRQSRRPANDGTWGQGSLGRRVATYRDCTFVGVRFRIRAGYSVGLARFEGCTFERCDFAEHFSFCADYRDNIFVGEIKKAVFYGRAPDGHYCDGKTNVFEGNDFTRARLRDVAFRDGVKVGGQLWPEDFDPALFITG